MLGLVSYKLLLAEKDKQIEILKDQILDLKKVVNAYMYPPQFQSDEQENILESQLKRVEVQEYTPEQLEQMQRDEEQARRMLTGDLLEA